MVAYACDSMCMCVEFRDKILLRGEKCKTRKKKSNFSRKGKTVISVENPEFFWFSDDETDFTVGIFLRNLVTSSNLVKFQDSRNFTFFKVPRVMSDT